MDPVETNTKIRKSMRLRCGKCEHIFGGPLLPMKMAECAKFLKSVRCPSCAADSQSIFAARDKALA